MADRRTIMKHTTKKLNRGFTIVELLLYISISSSILLATFTLLSLSLQSRIKNQAITEVNQQGVQVMNLIRQSIRAAYEVNLPEIGSEDPSLSLAFTNEENDPTVFDLADGVIRVTEGAGSAIPLNNSRVIASDLVFQNVTRNNSYGIVRVQFTLSSASQNGRNEYEFSEVFIGSAALRNQ